MFDNSVPAGKVNFSSAEGFNDKKGKKKFRGGFKIESITQVRDPTRSLVRTKNTKSIWKKTVDCIV